MHVTAVQCIFVRELAATWVERTLGYDQWGWGILNYQFQFVALASEVVKREIP